MFLTKRFVLLVGVFFPEDFTIPGLGVGLVVDLILVFRTGSDLVKRLLINRTCVFLYAGGLIKYLMWHLGSTRPYSKETWSLVGALETGFSEGSTV